MSLKMNKVFQDMDQFWSVELIGDVDIQTSGRLKEELNQLLDQKECDINIDCANLSYIDSTGLGVLIGVLKRVKKSENDILITNAQQNILKLLKITGLDKIFVMK
jgi:anti-sigma B factor antagonist